VEKIERGWLESFESYQKWFEMLEFYSNKKEISYTMKTSYTSILRSFIRFLRAGGDNEANPDSIVAWAKIKNESQNGRDIIFLQNDFALWLQGKEVKGYEKRVSKNKRYASERTADNTSHGTIRGFFIHNDVLLPKSGRKKMSSRSKAKQNDENYVIFKPGKNGKEIADYELFRQFLSTLNIHDQTIIMCILSTSQDPGDVLSLNIDFVLNQPEAERFYWTDKRVKTQEDFRTFFSKETTRMLRRYVAQERKGARKDDPLFVRTMGRRISPQNLSENSRNVAKKMGLINGEPQNPFRPKRMRSIFRSACSIAGIEKGYINVFMGHRTDTSDGYLEKPRATLELRYQMVEPYLTVFSGDIGQEIIEMKEKVSEYGERQEKTFDLMMDIQAENKQLRVELGALSEQVGRFVGFIEILGYEYDPETGEVGYDPDRDVRAR
jgi:integrase